MKFNDIIGSRTKYLVIFCALLAISGCKKEMDVNYLIEHPAILEKELQSCMYSELTSNEQIQRCKTATEAQSRIQDYLEVQQIDPEKFGQDIIEAEMALGKLKMQLETAKQVTLQLKTENASLEKIQASEIKEKQIEEAYLAKQREVKMMLGVARLGSP